MIYSHLRIWPPGMEKLQVPQMHCQYLRKIKHQKSGNKRNLPVDAVFTYWGLACSLCNREVFLPEGGTFKLKLIMILGNKHCPTILAFVAPSSHLNLNSICLKLKYILCFIYSNTFIVVSYRWTGAN